MAFGWDGNDDNGFGLADGVYYYTLSATENASSMALMMSSQQSVQPTSPLKAALAEGKSSYFIQMPPLPPPLGQKDASPQSVEVKIPQAMIDAYQGSVGVLAMESSFQNSSSSSSGGGGQSTTGPTKPPVKPVKGVAGTFGVVTLTYPNSLTNNTPPNGLFGQVQIEGITGSLEYDPVPEFNDIGKGFARSMGRNGWKTGFKRTDAHVSLLELQRSDLGFGGGSIFNSVNIGLFMSHGSYGTSLDWTAAANASLQTYFPIGGTNPPNSWMRLSDFYFDGPNLRWMAILACNSLRDENYLSMLSKFALPVGEQFHFICGGNSTLYAHPKIGRRWSYNMNVFNQTIQTAWYNAGSQSYHEPTVPPITSTVIFSIVGWDSTFNDRLKSYVEPDPDFDLIDRRDFQVFP